MKLTKTQIEKMIMEELEGIDEITRTSRQADVFDYSQDSYMGREDEEEMEKNCKKNLLKCLLDLM